MKGRERAREGEWFEVKNRRSRRQFLLEERRVSNWDIFGRLDDKRRKDASSFFFTQIPDNFGAKDMYRIFARYGEIKEVVIPSKRDKLGKRYGFARFLYVHDYRRLALQLDNIIIGRTKIFVNIPRFKRDKDDQAKRGSGDFQSMSQGDKSRGEPHSNAALKVLNIRNSYAEVVKGKAVAGDIPVFKVKEATLQEMEMMHVGEVRCAGDTYLIQGELYREGIFSIKAIPMGANLVLLVDKEKDACKSVLTEFSEWVEKKFVKVVRWDPRMVDKERVTWIRCYGIPPQAWNSEFFGFISNFVGTFLAASPKTCKLESLDVASLKIRTSSPELINLSVTVLINELKFSIRISEVIGDMLLEDSRETKKDHFCATSDDESFIPESDAYWQQEMDSLMQDGEEEEEEEGAISSTARVAAATQETSKSKSIIADLFGKKGDLVSDNNQDLVNDELNFVSQLAATRARFGGSGGERVLEDDCENRPTGVINNERGEELGISDLENAKLEKTKTVPTQSKGAGGEVQHHPEKGGQAQIRKVPACSMQETIERYRRHTRSAQPMQKSDEQNMQNFKQETSSLMKKIELLEASKRQLLGEGLGSCSLDELQKIEQQLEKSVITVRARKSQLYQEQIEQLKEKEKTLLAENARLISKQYEDQPVATTTTKDLQRENQNQPYAESSSSPSSDVVTELSIGLHRSS